jgi:hypothetical protein
VGGTATVEVEEGVIIVGSGDGVKVAVGTKVAVPVGIVVGKDVGVERGGKVGKAVGTRGVAVGVLIPNST